ncbi:WhiB family transcriptional regulator [Rhodococcus sp. NPDC057014]|uniref:WhiB family transcriptional regulator n=1 Tax=Rhodococcus sp. NPDC057014 TaxID=3346000 RepID=UPI003626E0D4
MPSRNPLRIGAPAEEWDWQLQARCRNMDTNTLFHLDGDGRGEQVRREAAAKSICTQCPVIGECRRYALNANETFGVWGGTTERDRRANRTGPDRIVPAAEEIHSVRLPSPGRRPDTRWALTA